MNILDVTEVPFNKWVIPLILAAITVLMPIKSSCIVVVLLVMGDCVLGVWAAKKRGDKITSARLRDSVSKMVIYLLGVTLAFITQEFLTGDIFPLVKIMTTGVGFVEIKSVFENSGEILGKPIFTTLLNILGSKNRDN